MIVLHPMIVSGTVPFSCQVSALRHADRNNVAQLTEAIAGARRWAEIVDPRTSRPNKR